MAIGLAVQDEIRVLAAIGAIAPGLESVTPERALAGGAHQPLDADDDVGVDVLAQQRRGDGAEQR